MYVIKRLDQGGGFVAPAGSHRSYTKDVSKARVFRTREDAERERCGNEVIVDLCAVFGIIHLNVG